MLTLTKGQELGQRSSGWVRWIMAGLLVLLVLPQGAGAAPPSPPGLPASFYGTVTVNGQNAPAGTVVSVGANGVIYAQATVVAYQGSMVYQFNVPEDDSTTPADDGGTAGETLQFFVGGQPVQTYVWQSGSQQALNLALSVSPTATVGPQSHRLYLPMVIK